MKEKEAYNILVNSGIRPSVQRLAIMDYLLNHRTHPTVDEIFTVLGRKISTLSRTTVYNTLRLFADHHAAQMLTIDERRVCYDGDTRPHVHFLCERCGKVIDLFDEPVPVLTQAREVNGNLVVDAQLYYRGICAECQCKEKYILNN
jgi:Fur family peroxide stress response transcriptional regulator